MWYNNNVLGALQSLGAVVTSGMYQIILKCLEIEMYNTIHLIMIGIDVSKVPPQSQC